MKNDPYRIDNIHDKADGTLLKTLQVRLEGLRSCTGKQCREAEG